MRIRAPFLSRLSFHHRHEMLANPLTTNVLLNGHDVDHLMAPGRTDHATPTPGALRTASGKVVYPETVRNRE